MKAYTVKYYRHGDGQKCSLNVLADSFRGAMTAAMETVQGIYRGHIISVTQHEKGA